MRLRDPKKGTVVRLEDADQSAEYIARGWVDADADPEPPKRRGRPAAK